MADVQSLDTRRRAIEALNDFLGDIKRRAINANNYYDVGRRLQPNSLPLPIATGSGYSMGYNAHHADNSNAGFNNSFSNSNFLDIFGQNGSTNNGGGMQGPLAQPGYSLPVPNARTKSDLVEIDRFLEQLQATVYESSSSAAAAGVQQPVAHAMPTDFFTGNGNQTSFRTSNSPPSHASNYSSLSSASGLAVSTSLETPVLTPASSSSYSSSGHSPLSSAGRPSLSSNNGMYPSLPSVTGISDLGPGYPATTSAPASGLASHYDDMDGRRYSNGRLQREPRASTRAESADVEMADGSEGAKTPRQEDITPKEEKDAETPVEKPTIVEPTASTPTASETEDKQQEEWVENIRVIEAIRKWINARLENKEYEDENALAAKKAGDDDAMNVDSDDKTGAAAVETAKAVEEKMAEALTHANAEHDEKEAAKKEVAYPSLPTA